MRKKCILFSFLALSAVSIMACSKSASNSNEDNTIAQTVDATSETLVADATEAVEETTGSATDFNVTDVSVDGWKMSIDNLLITNSLSHASTTLGYTSTDTETFEKTAADGNVFVLIKMTITKDGSTESIQWENMLLTDSDGNTYNRIEDTFIEDLNMKRLPGTTINFGSHEGWFAYEVPESATGLILSYQFSTEAMTYNVN